MSSSSEESASGSSETNSPSQNKYKGIRRRKWGKWVTEIRVPGTAERLWLGSYTTPEAAAVAHDVASYCLRGTTSLQNLNFPLELPAGALIGLSPRSVQKAASDAGLAIDAKLKDQSDFLPRNENWGNGSSSRDEYLSISVEDYDLQ
ncbi:hypothetical protein ACJIZ3_003098 [Penstemon smallii]|uniref:AP2/ERF domain-containing protein n=1 Tax=Penstemon smallii TaxID=265156 RepID=A0ABD3UBB5_9LAMI